MKRWIWAACLLPISLWAQSDSMTADAVQAFKAGDYATARTLFEVIVNNNPKDATARNYLKAIVQRQQGGEVKLETALRSIILPKVDFHDVAVRAAVTYVSQQVSQITGGRQVLNVVWIMPTEEEPHITISLQNIPASEAMRYIAESASLKLEYDAHAVKIRLLNSSASPSPEK